MGEKSGMRYFATNRALDDLSAAAGSRDERIDLQRGGYYFVDMDKYMAYYFGEVETEAMPLSAMVTDSQDKVFTKFLTDDSVGRIVVCVHGFNVEMFEAFTWFRVLIDTMRNIDGLGDRIVTDPSDLAADAPADTRTAFIGFSWPSNGSVLSYPSDQRDALGSANAFGNLLARLKKSGKSVNLICHSMGNYLACNTFKALIKEDVIPASFVGNDDLMKLIQRVDGKRESWLIDNYVMIAPDVERRHVTKAEGHGVNTVYVGPFYSGLEHLVHNVTNVYSRFDSALTVSDIEKKPREVALAAGDALSKWSFGLLDFLERNPDQKWEKRLGAAPHPLSAPPNFASVNATEVAGRKIDHSDHIDARDLVEAIADMLEIRPPPRPSESDDDE